MDHRLSVAGVPPGLEPVETWRRLRAVEGRAATVIDLYELVARPRGIRAQDLPAEERFALARSVMPEVWPGFEQTPDSARSGLIEVVDYDPAWPARFLEWRGVIGSALGSTATRIEHVGSTSVPGLAAKPIVDIQVSVDDLSDEAGYVPALERIGLQLRSRDELHRYFRPFADKPRDVHVHVCGTGSNWEREHLLFRDHLRADPEARDAYAEAKRAAALAWADDGWAYTDAKTEVVLQILERATSQ
jgi:GrpB-like predicted nucleotidyltransferase (UPF0157 family)